MKKYLIILAFLPISSIHSSIYQSARHPKQSQWDHEDRLRDLNEQNALSAPRKPLGTNPSVDGFLLFSAGNLADTVASHAHTIAAYARQVANSEEISQDDKDMLSFTAERLTYQASDLRKKVREKNHSINDHPEVIEKANDTYEEAQDTKDIAQKIAQKITNPKTKKEINKTSQHVQTDEDIAEDVMANHLQTMKIAKKAQQTKTPEQLKQAKNALAEQANLSEEGRKQAEAIHAAVAHSLDDHLRSTADKVAISSYLSDKPELRMMSRY